MSRTTHAALLRELLREEATKQAMCLRKAAQRVILARSTDEPVIALVRELSSQWVFVEAVLDRLCDLTDPDSRATVVRLVAKTVGLDTSEGAVFWHSDVNLAWRVSTPDREAHFVSRPRATPIDDLEIVIEGIEAVTDRADALTRIACAVLGPPATPAAEVHA